MAKNNRQVSRISQIFSKQKPQVVIRSDSIEESDKTQDMQNETQTIQYNINQEQDQPTQIMMTKTPYIQQQTVQFKPNLILPQNQQQIQQQQQQFQYNFQPQQQVIYQQTPKPAILRSQYQQPVTIQQKTLTPNAFTQPMQQPIQQQIYIPQNIQQQPQMQFTPFPPPATKSPQTFQINNKKYISLEQLGQGGNATVYKVMSLTGNIYALKVIQLKLDEKERQIQEIKQEVQMGCMFAQQNITLKIYDFQVDEEKCQILMQMGECSLKQYMQENPILSVAQIVDILIQIIDLVNQMHSLQFIHSDIKPQNFMFYRAKLYLIDFGISKQMVKDSTQILPLIVQGTPRYISPEVLKFHYTGTGKIHRSSDIWSVGCIAYELCNGGKSPFESLMKNSPPASFCQKLLTGDYQIDWDHIRIPQNLKHIIQGMLCRDDYQRLSGAEIKKQLVQLLEQ